MTAAELRTEITEGPLAATLAADWIAGNDAAIAIVLNNKSGSGSGSVNRKEVTRGELLETLASVSAIKPIKEAADNLNSPAFDICFSAMAILNDPLGTVDYTRSGTRSLVLGLGPLGYQILTQSQTDALVATCTRTGSRAEVLWGEGVVVTPLDVEKARKL